MKELHGAVASIEPGQHAVYHFIAKSVVRCTPNGEMLSGANDTGYLVDDLPAAIDYCKAKVEQNPKLACTVYDSNKKVIDQIFSRQYIERTFRANDPRRQLWIGALLLLVGAALIWLDARHEWMLIIGFLLGARFAVGGVVKITLSLSSWRKTP